MSSPRRDHSFEPGLKGRGCQVGEEDAQLGGLVGAFEARVGGQEVVQRLPGLRDREAVAAARRRDHRFDQVRFGFELVAA